MNSDAMLVYQGAFCGNLNELAVLSYFIINADEHGEVNHCYRYIGDQLGLSVDAIRAAIDRLEAQQPSRISDGDGGPWLRTVLEDGDRSMGWIVSSLPSQVRAPARPRATDNGFVYYAEAPGDRLKIGFSFTPDKRVAGFRTAEPRIRLVATERGSVALERKRHEEFAGLRLEGEWFQFADALRAHVDSLVAIGGERG